MTSFRRVAFPLGFVALCLCGGALLFLRPTADAQPSSSLPPTSASGAPAAPGTFSGPGSSGSGATAATGTTGTGTTASTTTGSPLFPQTIGVSPVQTGKKNFLVIGGIGDGSDSYDLQNENVYSLLRQRGVPIPNVLHPLSTAKPSFILERLIVYSLTASSSGGNSNATDSSSSSSGQISRGGPSSSLGGAAAAQAPQGPSDAEKTVSDVRQVVDAELSRGTGRLGGAHRQKLQLLRNAIRSLEAANRLGSIVTQAVGGARGASGAPASGGAGGDDKSKTDPREILYGQARLTARAADRYTPNIP